MPYNNPDSSLSPDLLPELAVALDQNLRVSYLRLEQFKTDPTITKDDAHRAVAFFKAVVADNARYTTLIKGWLKLRRVPTGHFAEAKRLLTVMRGIDGNAAKISALAVKLTVTGPDHHVPNIVIPISDVVFITAATNAKIVTLRQDIKRLKMAARSPFPLFTAAHLEHHIVGFRRVMLMSEPLPMQYRQWRREPLTPLQRRQVSLLARRVKVFRSLVTTALELALALQNNALDTRFVPTLVAGVLSGLVEDHPAQPASGDGKPH